MLTKLFRALLPGLVGLVAAAQPLTLREAVRLASERYPAVRVSNEQVNAAAAGIRMARLGYLPRADLFGQVNRASRNNIFGMVLPQSTLPSISGPVRAENDLTSVWGSAVGLLVSWEPFDFGLRKANVLLAEAGQKRAEAGVERTRFEVASLAADSFLTLLAAEQTERAAIAGVERARTLTTLVEALVKSELRPGADLSRSRAELAVAEAQRIRAREAVDTARITLQQLTGTDVSAVTAGELIAPAAAPPAADLASHPAAREQQTAVSEAAARLHAADRGFYPHFNVQGASYARGTGAVADGTTLGGANGLGPNIYNWGLGFSVLLPLFDLPAARDRRQLESARERTEQARYDLLLRDLGAAVERAQASLRAARDIAATTPDQLQAARDAERQATARYQAGLSTLAEVADTQRLLTQSEVDDALARLAIERAELNLARARGDLEPFLAAVGH